MVEKFGKFKPNNQVSKAIKPTNELTFLVYKTLGTSVIYRPMSNSQSVRLFLLGFLYFFYKKFPPFHIYKSYSQQHSSILKEWTIEIITSSNVYAQNLPFVAVKRRIGFKQIL